MDKISELKEELINSHNRKFHGHYFGKGFDTAIELQLPVKFRNWEHSKEGQFYIGLLSYQPSSQQLYDYWIEHVY